MNNDRLNAIRARLAAATPGPWRMEKPVGCCTVYTDPTDADSDAMQVCIMYGTPWDEWQDVANAALIAHAPADIAYLLTRIQEMEEALTEAHAFVLDCDCTPPGCKEELHWWIVAALSGNVVKDEADA